MKSFLIIDDIDAALRTMTDLGRRIVTPAATSVRNALLNLANRRGWTVVRHGAYVEWANTLIARHNHEWLALDPLFPAAAGTARVRPFRMTREFTFNQTVIHGATIAVAGGGQGSLTLGSERVGLVDDAVASARTVRRMAKLVSEAGGQVSHLAVCASSRSGHDLVASMVPDCKVAEYVPGDWSVIHLRDGCQYLPFIGKPAALPPIASADGTQVEQRVGILSVEGHAWRALAMDAAVMDALDWGQTHVVSELSAAVGCDATAGHIGLLGPHVPAVVPSGTVAVAGTLLRDLAGSA